MVLYRPIWQIRATIDAQRRISVLDGAVLLFDGSPVVNPRYRISAHHQQTWSLFEDRHGSVWPKGQWTCHLLDETVLPQLNECYFRDITQTFAIFSTPHSVHWSPFIRRVYIIADDAPHERASLIFEVEIFAGRWANPFTAGEYEEALERLAKDP